MRFYPRVPRAEASAWLAAADVLLVNLKDDPLFAITIPSKTQAYLAAGKPIIMAVAGDAADLVRKSGAGLVVLPENPPALAEAVIKLAAMEPAERARFGENGRSFYERELSFERATGAFATLLHAQAGAGSPKAQAG